MEQAGVSARNTTLVIRVVSIVVILAGFAVTIYALLVADPETVALVQGAIVGTFVMWPCGFLCGYIIANRRRQPQRVEGEVIDDAIEGEASQALTTTGGAWMVRR